VSFVISSASGWLIEILFAFISVFSGPNKI
jgi:hypothetical protein